MTLVGGHVYLIKRTDQWGDEYIVTKAGFASDVNIQNPPLLFSTEADAQANIQKVVDTHYERMVMAWGSLKEEAEQNIESFRKRKELLEQHGLWDDEQQRIYDWHMKRNSPPLPERLNHSEFEVVPWHIRL